MKLVVRQMKLPLRHMFKIATDARDVQDAILVELHDGEHVGYGEAATVVYYNVTLENMRAALERARPYIEAVDHIDDPAAFWEMIRPHLQDSMFALCAVDQAAHDVWGKRLGKPVYELWGYDVNQAPLSNYTIGIDTIERMVMKMKEFDGWPIYKIKLGTSEDIAIIRELRKHTNAIFRVDANTSWEVEETIANSFELRDLGVEFIEQPLKADNWEGMKEVYARSALPIMADESCHIESDVARCKGYFHGVNVKLTKAGGLTPGRRMLIEARELGLKTMVGCMTESSAGISAIGQLLPLLDYVDMDGAALLKEDPAQGVYIDKGQAIFPRENGTGASLRPGMSHLLQ